MIDVLLVCLSSTAGLRAAEDELAGALERGGASVRQVRARRPREVRTFALTDLTWALAARRAATAGIREHGPRAVVYSTTTAALLWPRPGAIRFDALAAATRPGRHGVWQRPVERRRLGQASVLVPQAAGALEGVTATTELVVVPVPVGPSGTTSGPRDIAAITYGAHWRKKGLDRVLAAWALAGASGGLGELVVAGVGDEHVGAAWLAAQPLLASCARTPALPPGVRVVGPLAPPAYRALLRRARVFVTAPRREDYGIAQLEALADGCTLVTTAAPGPYVALPLARALDPGRVVARGDDVDGLAAAVQRALRAPADAPQATAARVELLLAPFTRVAADRAVTEALLPRLLGHAADAG